MLRTASFNLIGCTVCPYHREHEGTQSRHFHTGGSKSCSELWVAGVCPPDLDKSSQMQCWAPQVSQPCIPGHQRTKRCQAPSEGRRQGDVRWRDVESTRGRRWEGREACQEGQRQLGVIWDCLHPPACDHGALLQVAQPSRLLWKLGTRTTGVGHGATSSAHHCPHPASFRVCCEHAAAELAFLSVFLRLAALAPEEVKGKRRGTWGPDPNSHVPKGLHVSLGDYGRDFEDLPSSVVLLAALSRSCGPLRSVDDQ